MWKDVENVLVHIKRQGKKNTPGSVIVSKLD